jgi:polysaccharide deacetylase 2 family uncharacterized protein YibQ
MACREFKPSEYRKKSASFRLLAFISPFIVFSLAVFVTMYPFVARSYWTPQKQIIISREMILESQDDLSEYTDTVEWFGDVRMTSRRSVTPQWVLDKIKKHTADNSLSQFPNDPIVHLDNNDSGQLYDAIVLDEFDVNQSDSDQSDFSGAMIAIKTIEVSQAPVSTQIPERSILKRIAAGEISLDDIPDITADSSDGLKNKVSISTAERLRYDSSNRGELPIGLLVGQKGETSEITVIITAVGMIEEASHAAIYELPPEVSIAVALVAKDAAFWGESAASAGHTVLVESPMEPYNYPQVDPGELTLLTGAAYSDNINRLGRILEKVPSAKGISTYLGGKFLADRKALQPVIFHLFKEKLFVFENGNLDASHLKILAKQMNVPYAAADFILDKNLPREKMHVLLNEVEKRAVRSGRAVLTVPAFPRAIDDIKVWIDGLKHRGFVLARSDFGGSNDGDVQYAERSISADRGWATKINVEGVRRSSP